MSKKTLNHEIVILGGHYAGMGMAHYLLRHVIPLISLATSTTRYHLTIVAPHAEFFNPVPAPRYLVGKGLIPTSKMFLSIPDALKEYSADQYSLVQGKAVALDAEKKVVTVDVQGRATQKVGYETLVIATGTASKSGLLQVNDNQEVTKSLFSSVQAALFNAKRILVGGGAVGVETAGEVAMNYPDAEISIFSGAERLLPQLMFTNSKKAENKLKNMGVAVVHKLRIASSRQNTDGTTTVVLSDGSERNIDLFIDATGGKPNTSFLPSAWLNSKGYVINDDKTLRTNIPGVYAIGDVASYSTGSIIDIYFSVTPLDTSIGVDLMAQIGTSTLFRQKIYKPFRDTQFVTIGPQDGVGQVMGWEVPSWVVWLMKSRKFLVDKADSAVRGQDYLKP